MSTCIVHICTICGYVLLGNRLRDLLFKHLRAHLPQIARALCIVWKRKIIARSHREARKKYSSTCVYIHVRETMI